MPQVIAWLQFKGFDDEAQRAFQGNGMTSDVLFELDAPALKDEIGVMAFGKHVRLLKTISELKRESERQAGKPNLVTKGARRDEIARRDSRVLSTVLIRGSPAKCELFGFFWMTRANLVLRTDLPCSQLVWLARYGMLEVCQLT